MVQDISVVAALLQGELRARLSKSYSMSETFDGVYAYKMEARLVLSLCNDSNANRRINKSRGPFSGYKFATIHTSPNRELV
jgi:hypothetical protein